MFLMWLFCVFVQPSLSDSEDLEEMERLRKEHIEALREIKRLQVNSPHVISPILKEVGWLLRTS